MSEREIMLEQMGDLRGKIENVKCNIWLYQNIALWMLLICILLIMIIFYKSYDIYILTTIPQFIAIGCLLKAETYGPELNTFRKQHRSLIDKLNGS